MAFPREILISGINLANNLTAGVQSTVTHYPYSGQDGDGNTSYLTAVTRACVVDRTTRNMIATVGSSAGQLVTTLAKLTFVSGGVTMNPKDVIVLADGSSAPIVAVGGVDDPETGKGFVTEVVLGK
jgi:hypothetical protein